jgi:hypothetical protein
MARHRCRSSLSRPDVVGCGREVAERVKKTTSILETKKEQPSIKLHGDPEIPTSRRSPREPLCSHKLLDVIVGMGPNPCRVYWRRYRRHHLSATPPNQNPITRETEPSYRWGARSTPAPLPEGQNRGRSSAGPMGDKENPNRLLSVLSGEEIRDTCKTTPVR